MSKRSTVPFVDPALLEKMQQERDKEDLPELPSGDVFPSYGNLVDGGNDIKAFDGGNNIQLAVIFEDQPYPNPELDALRIHLRKVETERDHAIAQVALLKSVTKIEVPRYRSDGSREVTLVLDPDKVARFEAWAGDYGMTFEAMAQQQIMEALDAYAG